MTHVYILQNQSLIGLIMKEALQESNSDLKAHITQHRADDAHKVLDQANAGQEPAVFVVSNLNPDISKDFARQSTKELQDQNLFGQKFTQAAAGLNVPSLTIVYSATPDDEKSYAQSDAKHKVVVIEKNVTGALKKDVPAINAEISKFLHELGQGINP